MFMKIEGARRGSFYIYLKFCRRICRTFAAFKSCRNMTLARVQTRDNTCDRLTNYQKNT